MVEDIQAWRAGDSTSKILISSVDKNIKAESQSFKMSGVFPAENNVTNSNNYKSGSIKGVYKKADGNSWIDVTELGGNKISVKGQASWEGSGVNSGQVNSGVIDGVVILNGNNGVYSQNGCEINLTFVPSGLIAKDNNQCGGLNVSFTGNYTRFQDSSSGGSSQITTSPEINIKGWLYAPTNGPEWTLKEVTAGYNPNTDNDVYSGRNFNLVFNSNSKCFSWVVSQGKPTSKAQISCPTATKGFGEGGSGDRVRVSGVLISSTLTVSSVELVSTLPVDQW